MGSWITETNPYKLWKAHKPYFTCSVAALFPLLLSAWLSIVRSCKNSVPDCSAVTIVLSKVVINVCLYFLCPLSYLYFLLKPIKRAKFLIVTGSLMHALKSIFHPTAYWLILPSRLTWLFNVSFSAVSCSIVSCNERILSFDSFSFCNNTSLSHSKRWFFDFTDETKGLFVKRIFHTSGFKAS